MNIIPWCMKIPDKGIFYFKVGIYEVIYNFDKDFCDIGELKIDA